MLLSRAITETPLLRRRHKVLVLRPGAETRLVLRSQLPPLQNMATVVRNCSHREAARDRGTPATGFLRKSPGRILPRALPSPPLHYHTSPQEQLVKQPQDSREVVFKMERNSSVLGPQWT